LRYSAWAHRGAQPNPPACPSAAANRGRLAARPTLLGQASGHGGEALHRSESAGQCRASRPSYRARSPVSSGQTRPCPQPGRTAVGALAVTVPVVAEPAGPCGRPRLKDRVTTLSESTISGHRRDVPVTAPIQGSRHPRSPAPQFIARARGRLEAGSSQYRNSRRRRPHGFRRSDAHVMARDAGQEHAVVSHRPVIEVMLDQSANSSRNAASSIESWRGNLCRGDEPGNHRSKRGG